MIRPVLVTGARGNVGAAVVSSLRALGLPVRTAGTDPGTLRRAHAGVDAVRLDFRDRATFRAALAGAGALFLLRPPAIADVNATLNRFLDVAAQSPHLQHVVFSSVTGAESNTLVPHHRIEAHLRRLSLPWTILRPGFFAQNLASAYRDDIVTADRIFLPAGAGTVAFVDTRDVGEVAARILAEPAPHRGAAYTLTGPEALDFDAVARILSHELGRTVRYEPASTLAYARHLHRQGLTAGQILVQTALHRGLRSGSAATVEDALPGLLGRGARTVAEYVHDHRQVWQTPV